MINILFIQLNNIELYYLITNEYTTCTFTYKELFHMKQKYLDTYQGIFLVDRWRVELQTSAMRMQRSTN